MKNSILFLFDKKSKLKLGHYTSYTGGWKEIHVNDIIKPINMFCCCWIFSYIYQSWLLAKSKKYWTLYWWTKIENYFLILSPLWSFSVLYSGSWTSQTRHRTDTFLSRVEGFIFMFFCQCVLNWTNSQNGYLSSCFSCRLCIF